MFCETNERILDLFYLTDVPSSSSIILLERANFDKTRLTCSNRTILNFKHIKEPCLSLDALGYYKHWPKLSH